MSTTIAAPRPPHNCAYTAARAARRAADPRRLRLPRRRAGQRDQQRARMPHWTALLATSPHTTIDASELHVGLPDGQMGNSEVGHLNIGAGRVDLPGLHAHRPRDRDRRVRAQSGAGRRASARPRAAARRCTCWACCRRAACTATSGRSPRWSSWPRPRACAHDLRACVPRRPRHAAAQRGGVARVHATASARRRRARASRRSSAAISRWTATSAGTASRRRTTCWSTAARRSPPRPPQAGARRRLRARRERRVREGHRDRRRRRHVRRR